MCGIAGYVGGHRGGAGVVRRMTAALAHRGPDGEGHQVRRLGSGAQVVLGHRRLAVIDPSPAGAQPMLDPITGNVITFNGEIYNFRHLRAALQAQGKTFRSGTDTEVILAAYAEWGEACLERLRGIFAFAIYDVGRQCLFLARDRLGVKPLYFWVMKGDFLFASEVRALLSSGLIPRNLDETGVASFLSLGAVQEPRTIVAEVRALPAAHKARWKDGRFEIRPYWQLEPGRESASCRAVTREVEQVLAEAVRSQLMSDVPIGAFLSGGLDSTAVVALMRRAAVSVRTVSVVFPESGYSESVYSREAARTFGVPNDEICIHRDQARLMLPRALGAMDQPTVDGINTYIVAGAAREAGLTVALSGLGGDELFGGYPSFRRVRWLERALAVPKPVRRVAVAIAGPWAGRRDSTRKLAALLGNGTTPHAAYLTVRTLFTPAELSRLLPGRTPVNVPIPDPPGALLADDFTLISWLELRHYTLNMLLRDTDVMSMAHGLEVRVPLLDDDLVNLILRIPGRLKSSGPGPKPLLAAALRGELPDAILRRRKRGFALPFAEWLQGRLGDDVADVLLGSGSGDVVSRQACCEVWDAHLRGETSWHRPWALYVLARWVDRNLAIPTESVFSRTAQMAEV